MEAILSAGSRQVFAQRTKDFGGLLVESEDGQFHQQFDAVPELFVAVNLFGAAGLLLADEGTPAFGDFLRGDDRRRLDYLRKRAAG